MEFKYKFLSYYNNFSIFHILYIFARYYTYCISASEYIRIYLYVNIISEYK